VFDSGKSIKAIIDTLQEKSRKNTPKNIRIAVPWFKPNNNTTDIIPEYYLHKTDDWLIFPHEMDGLTKEEIFKNKPGLKEIFSMVKS
jgi:hypoxanthine-guanine phosphoribosyltransferase